MTFSWISCVIKYAGHKIRRPARIFLQYHICTVYEDARGLSNDEPVEAAAILKFEELPRQELRTEKPG